jgi:hypothetical protein
MLSREDRTRQEKPRDQTRKTALAQLRWFLDPDTIYGDVNIYFENLGKTLLFLDEDEYAVLAYQMPIRWAELDDNIVQDMTYICDNCGNCETDSSFPTARYVCRTCVDIDLCEPCHELYKAKRCCKALCTGHIFLKVPTIPEEEIKIRFQLSENAEYSPYYRQARPRETSDIWIAQLRIKYTADLVSRSSTGSQSDDSIKTNLPSLAIFLFCRHRKPICTALLHFPMQFISQNSEFWDQRDRLRLGEEREDRRSLDSID